MSVPEGAKAWVGATISLVGMVRCPGMLHPIKDNSGEKETKMFMVCPKCHQRTLDQLYCCSSGCVPAATDEEFGKAGFRIGNITERGRVENDKTVVMTAEEIADAKGSKLEKGLIDISRSPAEQVDAETWAAGGAWWFEPTREDPIYALLVEAVNDPAFAHVAMVNLAGSEKFVRLRPHKGGIIVEEQLRPSDVKVFSMGSLFYSEKERKMFDVVMQTITEDFEPDAFNSDKITALRELIASKSGDPSLATVTPIGKAKGAPADLEDQLAAALAIAQATRAAKAS